MRILTSGGLTILPLFLSPTLPPLSPHAPPFPSLYVSPTNVAIDCFTAWLGKYWRIDGSTCLLLDGEVPFSFTHFSMLARSYVCPSAMNRTGSLIN